MRNKTRNVHINSKRIPLNFHQKKRIKRLQKDQERNQSKFLKSIVYEDKQSKGCFVCKESFPYALSYHHLNPEEKSFDIGTEVKKGKVGKKTLYKELSKCILLCLCCHVKVEHGLIVLDLDEIARLKDKESQKELDNIFDISDYLDNSSNNNYYEEMLEQII